MRSVLSLAAAVVLGLVACGGMIEPAPAARDDDAGDDAADAVPTATIVSSASTWTASYCSQAPVPPSCLDAGSDR